ncbi:MAG: outer membrane beta-barrel protein [Deltaproteobacteria bacterium]
MLKTVSIAAIAFALAGTANAGTIAPTPVEPMIETPTYAPAATVDWTGGYVGASIVGGRLDNGVTTDDTRGFGLQAGYLRDLGGFVVGGELAYVKGEATGNGPSGDLTSTRLKAIGGYNAGSFLPYATLGVSQLDGNGASDTAMLYGVGVKYAINQSWTAGLEYVVEQKDNFDNSGFDVENRDLALSINYRF